MINGNDIGHINAITIPTIKTITKTIKSKILRITWSELPNANSNNAYNEIAHEMITTPMI